MRRTRLAVAESDLLLLVVDANAPPPGDVLAPTPDQARIVVLAKCDLPAHPAHAAWSDAVAVSALAGHGMPALIARLEDEVRRRTGADESAIVASLRQMELLGELHAALERAERALGEAPLEAALVDLRIALTLVSRLVGIDVDDAILDRIFSTFCLGK